MLLKVLSWNVGEWNAEEIIQTIKAEQPDIIFLSEFMYMGPIKDALGNEIKDKNGNPIKKKAHRVRLTDLNRLGYEVNFADKKVCIAYKNTDTGEKYTPFELTNSDRVLGLGFNSPNSDLGQLSIFGLHLIDKFYRTEFDQFVEAQKHANKINEYCCKSNIQNFVILGDFNMNPWEQGLTNPSSFNSTYVFKISGAVKQGRIRKGYEGKERLYNPTWLLIADGIRNEESSHGTYYFKAPNLSETDWNFIDQVLLNENMIGYFKFDDSFKIGLANSTKTKAHFPLCFTINLSKQP